MKYTNLIIKGRKGGGKRGIGKEKKNISSHADNI